MKAVPALAIALATISSIGCDSPTEPGSIVVTGTWAGTGIVLVANETGATVQYDCAHGTIDEPLRLDGNGRFDVGGRHVFEAPGPVSDRLPEDSHSARYSGSVAGEAMTLSVTIVDRGQTFGPFVLTLGSPPVLRKCLSPAL